MTKRQALVIGINEYPDGDSLSTAAQDAEKIAQLLEKYGSFEVHRLPIYDKREVSQDLFVTSPELEAAITQLFQPKSGIIPETALLFFAGHGWRSEKDGQPEGFLVTSDALFEHDSEDGLFSLKSLHQILKDSPVRQQIVWLDCCHSGELFNFLEQNLAEFEQQRDFDRCFIAACREFQVAYGGVLTPALLQALDPTNKDDGIVTNHTLKPRLEAIPNNASQHFVVRNIGSQIILTYKGGVRGNICPYKGLKYFDFNPTKPEEAEDHRYFYGRTQLTNQLLDKVRSSNFIAVIGASGSGKSSVVRAGLLYQIYLGKKIPGSDRWTIYQPFTPGINPIKSLEQVVGKLTAPDDLVHFIERLPTERVVLVIDQFEEIFTQCLDEKERQKFFMYLMGAVESLENKLCLVLVMRDDFQQKCTDQEYPGLPHKIENNLVRVLRMNRPELQEVILKPAELVELEIDRDLVNEMIADVLDSAGDLALLQYTLTQLWENRSFNLLTISDYTSLGGVQKVLGNHADTVYQSLLSEEQKADGLKESEEQKAARRIFLELTRLSEDENTPNTRQQVWLKDLVNSQQSEELVNKVLQRLAYEKLVVTSKQELEGQRVAVVNIVHETLIRNWGLLGGWLEEHREALIIKQPIEDAAKEWRDKGKQRESAYLLQGTKLAKAEEYIKRYSDLVPLSGSTQEFVQKSIKNRKRNSRNLFVTVSVVILGLTGLAGWAFTQQRIADKRKTNAEINAESLKLESLLASGVDIEALIEGLKTGKNLKKLSGVLDADTKIRATAALQQVVYGVNEYNRFQKSTDKVYHVEFSPDGKTLVSQVNQFNYGSDQKFDPANQIIFKLWSLDGREINSIKGSYMGFSPDSKTISYSDFNNQNDLKLLNLDRKELKTIRLQSTKFFCVRLEYKTMISMNNDKDIIKLWNLDGKLLKTIKIPPYYGNGDFSCSVDGKLLAFKNGSVVNLEKSEIKTLKEPHKNNTWGISISPDNKIVASASRDGTVKLWNLDTNEVKTIQADIGQVWDVKFSPDGKTIAASGDRMIKIWNLDTTPVKTLRGNTDLIRTVSFSPDGKILASGSMNGTVKLWNLQGQGLTALKEPDYDLYKNYRISYDNNNSVESASFSPDGKLVTSITGNGKIKLWDLEGRKLKTFSHTQQNDAYSPSYSVSFSPDSKTVFSFKTVPSANGDNGIIEIRNLNGQLLNTLKTGRGFSFSPNGKMMSTSDGGIVKLWNISGQLINSIKADEKLINSISFSSDGKIVATSNGNIIKLWNIDGKIMKTFQGDGAFFIPISLSPDGKMIAAAGNDNMVKLWNVDSQEFKNIQGHSQPVTSVTFSPDSQTIISSSEDGTVKLWSLQGQELSTLKGHISGGVNEISLSPNGKIIASAGDDGTVILWNLDLDDLMSRGCNWLHDYLKNNQNVSDSDKHLCDGISNEKN